MSNVCLFLFLECIGSAFLEFTIIKVMTNVKLINNDPDRYIRGVLVGGLVTGTVVLFMDISGSMMNPTLATLLLGMIILFYYIQENYVEQHFNI